MEQRTSQLIYLLFSGWVFGAGSYEFLQFPMDARSLALHNSASANDGLLLSDNPASLSKLAKGNTYSYFYLPANIHFTGFQNVNHSSSGVRAYKISFMSYGQSLMEKRRINHTLLIYCLNQDSKRNIKILPRLEFPGVICSVPL